VALQGLVVTALVVAFQPDSGTTEVITTIFSQLPSSKGKKLSDYIRPEEIGARACVRRFFQKTIKPFFKIVNQLHVVEKGTGLCLERDRRQFEGALSEARVILSWRRMP
jgi:hypothetical protein